MLVWQSVGNQLTSKRLKGSGPNFMRDFTRPGPEGFWNNTIFKKNHVFLKMRQFGKKNPPKSLMIQNGLLLEQQQLEGKIRVCIRTSQRKGVMAELSKPVERKGAMCVVLV